MKRKAEKQQTAGTVPNFQLAIAEPTLIPFPGPVSAFAARKARQQQAQSATVPKHVPQAEPAVEPPSKRPRHSLEEEEPSEMNGTDTRGPRTRSSKKQEAPLPAEAMKGQQRKVTGASQSRFEPRASESTENLEEEEPEEDPVEEVEGVLEMSEDEVASVAGEADGYESPADTRTELQNFPLSKARLGRNNIVYGDGNTLCIRIKERTVWVNVSRIYLNDAYA